MRRGQVQLPTSNRQLCAASPANNTAGAARQACRSDDWAAVQFGWCLSVWLDSFLPMKRVLGGLFILALFASPASAFTTSDGEARQAALQWLDLVDSGQYAKAYEARVPRVRGGGTVAEYCAWMRSKRAPFGRAKTRAFTKVVHLHTLAGAPDGNYIAIGFNSTFEHKAKGAESVVLSYETGRWQVSGYWIY
jgi:hypothetical protein